MRTYHTGSSSVFGHCFRTICDTSAQHVGEQRLKLAGIIVIAVPMTMPMDLLARGLFQKRGARAKRPKTKRRAQPATIKVALSLFLPLLLRHHSAYEGREVEPRAQRVQCYWKAIMARPLARSDGRDQVGRHHQYAPCSPCHFGPCIW